ncbi:MAG: hydrolase [Pseudomonadota bacterium]|nr:hydrolase [Pseudomonadota bacterium]
MRPGSFVPAPWLANAHLQTLYGALAAPAPRVAFRRERWDTPDGDFVDVDFVDGPERAPWVHLYHGLEGSSNSPYARMLMAHVRQRAWRGSVFHFRGCSGEPNRLARAYHSGDTEEIGWSLARVKALAGAAPLFAAGVSLGGNAFCKWLGEHGESARAIVERAAAVSAPLDLMAAGEALGRGFARVYAWNFLGSLRRGALDKLNRFPGLYDGAAVSRARTLRAFDNVVTAPLHGFRDTDDYWTRASAKPHLAGIRVPTLLVNARDDPFLPGSALPTEREVSGAVKLEFPEHGGHVGFVTAPFPGHIEWLPQRLLHFFDSRE